MTDRDALREVAEARLQQLEQESRDMAQAASAMRGVLRPIIDYCEMSDQRRTEALQAIRMYDKALAAQRPQPAALTPSGHGEGAEERALLLAVAGAASARAHSGHNATCNYRPCDCGHDALTEALNAYGAAVRAKGD